MGSLAEFQQRAVRGRYGVPLTIPAEDSLNDRLSQTSRTLFRFDGVPGYLFEGFCRHKDGGAICIYRHQESVAGRRLAVGADRVPALDKQGVMPASVYRF